MKRIKNLLMWIGKIHRGFPFLYFLNMTGMLIYTTALAFFPLICFYARDRYQLILACFGLIFISNIIFKILDFFFGMSVEKVTIIMDRKFTTKFQEIPYEQFENAEEMAKINRIVYPIKNQKALNYVFSNFSCWLQNVVQIFLMLFIVFQIHVFIGIICLIGFLVNFLLLKTNRKDEMQFYEAIMEDNRVMGYYTRLITETENIKEIIMFHGVDMVKNKVAEHIKSSTDLFRKLMKKLGRYDARTSLVYKAVIFIVYLISVYAAMEMPGKLSGMLVILTCLTAFSSISSSVLKYGFEFHQMLDFLEPYMEFMKKKTKKDEKKEGAEFLAESPFIEFRNVSFRYQGTEKWILKEVSFSITNGEFVTIVGQNGAGKSTILKLMLGLLKPTKGAIFLQGVNIEKLEQDQIYQLFHVVFQDFVIFPDTMEENILLGQRIEREKLEGILSFLDLSKEERNKIIGLQYSADAMELSGGQKQKIAIARALLEPRECLAMDEPTAALDALTEKELVDYILETHMDKTRIMISHRMSTCVRSDGILVLQDGRLAEKGAHEELMKQNGVYAELFGVQKEMYYETEGNKI